MTFYCISFIDFTDLVGGNERHRDCHHEANEATCITDQSDRGSLLEKNLYTRRLSRRNVKIHGRINK